MLINERDPALKAYLDEWKTNRALIEGERDVKKPGCERFLPRDEGMSDLAYENFKKRTPFFPGAAKAHENYRGIASRKPATINAPANVADILNTITQKGYGLDKLAAQIFAELLITNFVGLVVDYPAGAGLISQSEAIERGIRPFIGMYTAEHILGIETATINNRQRVTRVRLQDNPSTIRELRLDNGVYSVNLWALKGGQWTVTQTITPTKGRNAETLDEIPFTLVSTEETFEPVKAPLADLCALNAQLYIAQSNLAQCHWWISQPIPYIIKKLAEGEDEISVAPGTIWRFDCDPKEAVVGFLEWAGGQVAELRQEVEALKSDMAKLGGRMLADDKRVAEAAETEAIRRAAEDAFVANLIRARDWGLNDQLAWFSWWLDLEEDAISFEASTDLNAIPLTAQDWTFRAGLRERREISKNKWLDMLIEHDVLPETFDREENDRELAEELADMPPTVPLPGFNTGAPDDGEIEE